MVTSYHPKKTCLRLVIEESFIGFSIINFLLENNIKSINFTMKLVDLILFYFFWGSGILSQNPTIIF